MRRALSLLLMTAAGFLAGCGGSRALHEPTFVPRPYNWGGGPERDHRAASVISPPLELAWTARCEAATGRALSSDGRFLFVGLQHGKYEVLDLETGHRRSRRKLAPMGEVTTAVTRGGLLSVLRQGSPALRLLDFTTGEVRWQADADGVAGEPVVLDDGVAVVGDRGDYRFYSDDGRLLAQRALKAAVWAGPTASDSAVFLAAHDGRLWALSHDEARVLWTRRLSGEVAASPTLHDGRVFIGSLDGRFHALDAATGQALWSVDLGGGVFETAAAAGDTVYAGTARGVMVALSAQNGDVIWRVETGSTLGTSLVVSGEALYLGLLDFRFLSLSRATGQEVWSAKLKGRVRTTPLIVGSWLVVASEGRTVYGFRHARR